jgi:Phage tail repeat like
MKIAFRQGLVSYQKNGLNQPTFLNPSMTANWVAFDVAPTPTVVAFAHGASDYLMTFDVDVDAAWGPLTPLVTNYLFWDIDLLTGEVTRGITTLAPISQLTAPAAPANGQHWFDLTTTTMKVWNSTRSKWYAAVRVFAGHVPNGNTSQIVAYTVGSQVGLVQDTRAGFLIFDSNVLPSKPLRQLNGEFVTTATAVRVKTSSGTTGVLAPPLNSFIPVRASENIPRFSIVYFSGEDTVGLASSNPSLPQAKTPIGMVQDDLDVNEVGVLTQAGEVSWDQWDWSADIGKPLYCGENGEIVTTRPMTLMAYRVGFVKNDKTILFQVDSETLPQIYQAEANDIIINGTAPISTSYQVVLDERIWTVTMPAASASQNGYATSAQVAMLTDHETRLDQAEADILARALLAHTHAISEVTGLQLELDTLTTALAGKADKVVPATVGNFAALSATGNLLDSGLQPSAFSLVGHGHTIVDVAGLQTALNGKAALTHTHAIADVTNLQSSLDSKALLVHTHAIADVTGLQGVLDGKAALSHTHAMSEVVGLTAALALKADVGHTHTIGDIAALQSSLDGKIDFTNTTVFTPTQDYNPATKKYVDDAVAGGAFVLGSIDTHPDVDTTTTPPTTGQVLKWDGANWVPGNDNDTVFTIGSIDQHTDVDTVSTAPAVGQVLKWNGINWTPAADSDTVTNPAGADTQVQYNTAGAFDASAGFTFNSTTFSVGLGTPTNDAEVAFASNGRIRTQSNHTLTIDFPSTAGPGGSSIFLLGGESTNPGGAGLGGSVFLRGGDATNAAATTGGVVLQGGQGAATTGGSVSIETDGLPRLAVLRTGAWGINGANYGTNGQVLTSTGNSSSPTWTSPVIIAPGYEEQVAVAAQTIVTTTVSTVAKAAGKSYLQVFVNGVFQQEGTTKAYTVTGPNQLTFNSGLALNDDIVIYAFA